MGDFVINLTETEGDGEFSCPKCKETISPDDDSGKTYDVLNVEEEDGLPKKVTIECKKCGSVINLFGFEALKEVNHSESLSFTDDYLSLIKNERQDFKAFQLVSETYGK